MILASVAGLWNTVKYCLEKGTKEQINQTDHQGLNAVMHACQSDQINCLQVLLSNERSLSQIHEEACRLTPLIVAVQKGSLDTVELLLKKGANVNQLSPQGSSALTTALREDNNKLYRGDGHTATIRIVRSLLAHEANVNQVCAETGETPLILAADLFDLQIIQDLVRCGADVNVTARNGDSALSRALRTGEYEVVVHLLKRGASLKNIDLEAPGRPKRFTGDRTVGLSQLLILAGWGESDQASPTPKRQTYRKEGVVSSLFDLCRDPARQHVQITFPESNLLHTVPRLPLPDKMKRFLLYDCVTIASGDCVIDKAKLRQIKSRTFPFYHFC